MNTAAALPDNERCARCGQAFRCGVADGHCACFGLQLSAELIELLRRQSSRCLCLACLQALAGQHPAPGGQT